MLTTSKSARFLSHNNYLENVQPDYFAHHSLSLPVHRKKAKLHFISIKFVFVSATKGQYTSVYFAAREVHRAYSLCV